MYIFFCFVHNKNIRLIIVEQRVLIDLILWFINIRAKRYNSVFLYYYMSAIRVYYVCVGYILYFYSFIYGQNICNIFELRLFFYLVFLVVVSSPLLWMNTVTCGGLIVEQLINICGIELIYIAIYIRF